METTRDYFGNELTIGDKIVFAKSEHSSLAIGEIIRIGKTGNTVTVKILVAPFGGYYRKAESQIGEEVKVMLTKTVNEEDVVWRPDPNAKEWEGKQNRYRQYYDTKYVYAIKYFGEIPETPQYELIDEKLIENY